MALVLVVDDEPDIRDLLQLNLEGAGHRVVTAGDGDAAIGIVEREAPDLIFLDALMPGVDGWTVLERLKARDDALAGIPVIMVTALSESEDRLRGGIEGAVRYLTKPVHPLQILGALDDVLGPDAVPEAEQRATARRVAMEALAVIEAGAAHRRPSPRVRLTQLEQGPGRTLPPLLPTRITTARDRLGTLSDKQRELLRDLRATGSVAATAAALGTETRTVYAHLRRIVHRLGLRDSPELLRTLADGHLDE